MVCRGNPNLEARKQRDRLRFLVRHVSTGDRPATAWNKASRLTIILAGVAAIGEKVGKTCKKNTIVLLFFSSDRCRDRFFHFVFVAIVC